MARLFCLCGAVVDSHPYFLKAAPAFSRMPEASRQPCNVLLATSLSLRYTNVVHTSSAQCSTCIAGMLLRCAQASVTLISLFVLTGNLSRLKLQNESARKLWYITKSVLNCQPFPYMRHCAVVFLNLTWYAYCQRNENLMQDWTMLIFTVTAPYTILCIFAMFPLLACPPNLNSLNYSCTTSIDGIH